MPVTQQIIKTIVSQQIKEELVPVNKKIDDLNRGLSHKIDALARNTNEKFGVVNQKIDTLNTKVDKMMDIVVDFAGQVKKFNKVELAIN